MASAPPSSLAASSWFAGAGTLTGPQLALVARLGAWVQQARITALDALRAPPDQVPPLPSLSLAGPPDSGTAGEEISALRLGLYKLATYRLPASLTSLAIGWALSGNFYTGVQVMLWQGLTYSVVYFGNEMAWEWPQTVPLMPFIGGRDAVATDNENPAATGGRNVRCSLSMVRSCLCRPRRMWPIRYRRMRLTASWCRCRVMAGWCWTAKAWTA